MLWAGVQLRMLSLLHMQCVPALPTCLSGGLFIACVRKAQASPTVRLSLSVSINPLVVTGP